MDKALKILFNNFMKSELQTMFGNDYDIKINSFNYSTQKKSFVVDITLISSNLDEEEMTIFYPDGLNYIVDECWKFLGIDEPILLITSLEFVKK